MSIRIIRVICGWLLIVGLVIGCSHPLKTEEPVTKEPIEEKELGIMTLSEAIEIGKEELRRVGYRHWNEELIVSADDNNTLWNRHIRLQPSVLENEGIKKMNLKERKYWAIHYSRKCPKGVTRKGGNAWVFINRSNGKVIGFLGGE